MKKVPDVSKLGEVPEHEASSAMEVEEIFRAFLQFMACRVQSGVPVPVLSLRGGGLGFRVVRFHESNRGGAGGSTRWRTPASGSGKIKVRARTKSIRRTCDSCSRKWRRSGGRSGVITDL